MEDFTICRRYINSEKKYGETKYELTTRQKYQKNGNSHNQVYGW
jgi:hypothetical protein